MTETSPGPPSSSRATHMAMLLLIIVVAAITGEPWSRLWNPDRVAPFDSLARSFEKQVFDYNHFGRVLRWHGPMRVVLRGVGGEPYIPDVERYLATISEIVGFEAKLSGEDGANVFLHFAPHDSFYEAGAT